uniref:BrxE family protein n=1 Tax=Pseudomonas sp. P1B16 TaxID=2986074 RepID=UPI0039B77F6C
MIKDAQTIAELRVLVGYLGEQQPAWWSSQFFSPTAAAFLGPVFARSTTLAQYQGVTAAAARKHEEHIGEGRTFHLFRLPEIFEQSAAGGSPIRSLSQEFVPWFPIATKRWLAWQSLPEVLPVQAKGRLLLVILAMS